MDTAVAAWLVWQSLPRRCASPSLPLPGLWVAAGLGDGGRVLRWRPGWRSASPSSTGRGCSTGRCAYADAIRSIPLLVLLFVSGLPAVQVRIDAFWAGVLALTSRPATSSRSWQDAVASIPPAADGKAIGLRLAAPGLRHLSAGAAPLPAAVAERGHRHGEGQRAGLLT